MRLEAAQVIEWRPEDVVRFVATDHFHNRPKWDRAVEQMTPTSPAPWPKAPPYGWSAGTGQGS